MDTSILAGFADLNMILPNLAIGWQREAAEARRIAGMYSRLSDPGDKARFGDTIGEEGRQWIAKADRLEKRVAAAREGYVYLDLQDPDFNELSPKWGELIVHARVQGRCVEAWPLTDGKGLTVEARLGQPPAANGPDLAGFRPDLSWTR
jgi:hypothetical protein